MVVFYIFEAFIYLSGDKKFSDDPAIVGGLGKINSALGVAHTFFKFKGLSNNIWINIGLAGHEREKIGTLILVDKIYDFETQT